MKGIQGYFCGLLNARAAGNHEAGLGIARAAHEDCPGDHVRTWYWQACMQSLMGSIEEAISALQAGLAEGVWWGPRLLESDTDLDPLRADPGFAAIAEECGRRFRKKQAASRPECLVVAPSTSPWAPRSLFLIHWLGDTAVRFLRYWQPLVDEGWTLIVPQSSQVFDSASFCWDDTELARNELRQHLEDCRRRRGLEMDTMIIAGASQGARLALEIAHEAEVPWLCVIPSFPTGYDASSLTAVPDRTYGAFLLGENDDPANSRARPVISTLRAGGVRILVRTMKDLGHDFPDDFATRAQEVLAALRIQAE